MKNKLTFKCAFDQFVDRDNVAKLEVYKGENPTGVTLEFFQEQITGDVDNFIFCLSPDDAVKLADYLHSLCLFPKQ